MIDNSIIRNYQRYCPVSYISYIRFNEKGEKIDAGRTLSVDMSMAGVCIKIDSSFNIDDLVELEIDLIDETIKTKAYVKRVDKINKNTYQIGMEFVDLTTEDKELIRKSLQER